MVALNLLDGRSVADVAGVGAKIAESLKHLEITSVADLLMHYPRRYVDRTNLTDIETLVEGKPTGVFGTVTRTSNRKTKTGKSLVEVTIEDATAKLLITFFNQGWRSKQLVAGTEAVFFGAASSYRGRIQMTNPLVDIVGDRTNKIVAIYPTSTKVDIQTWELARYIESALDEIGDIDDPLDAATLNMLDRTRAFRLIHFPETFGDRQRARDRLAFDELLRVQLTLAGRRRSRALSEQGIVHVVGGPLVGQFTQALPFQLTDAQKRVFASIAADLTMPVPMHRLLQGDVGSGKTIVAVLAMLIAIDSGTQAAIMAPTEVLAEQHLLSFRSLLSQLTIDDESLFGVRPLRVELFSAKHTAAERRQLVTDLQAGNIDIAVGTHALLSEGVDFRRLGIVIIDEQHRFGVDQRDVLRSKSQTDSDPDVLVMTATPIPRTAALAVYGDLDLSIIDELPPGRTPIKTKWATDAAQLDKTWQFVAKQVADGRQAYVVCPRIEANAKSEDSELLGDFGDAKKADMPSAIAVAEQLATGPLASCRLALLHGRMSSADKQQVMDNFRAGFVDVLVSTTVIEVGVDVPNATTMVILGADRFGIAQLHQLRGRVGRGSLQSWCVLSTTGEVTEDATRRLDALTQTTDGFALAEVDVELRGEGTLFGVKQSGRNDLKLASILRDGNLIELAQQVATDFVVRAESDIELRQVIEAELSILEVRVDDSEGIFRS